MPKGSRPNTSRVAAGRRRARVSSRRRAPPGRLPRSKRAGVKCALRREFRAYTKPLDKATSTPGTSWLDVLYSIGLFALKLVVTTLVGIEEADSADTKVYPLGTGQAMLIGIDECLIKHPFVGYTEYDNGSGKKFSYPSIPFQRGLIHAVKLRFQPGAKLSERAGRMACALVELSREEADALLQKRQKAKDWESIAFRSYDDILQIPGSVNAPLSGSMSLTWRPSVTSFAQQEMVIGQPSVLGLDLKGPVLPGGVPFLRLYVGYSDFASDDGAVSQLYAPNEALFTISISSNITLNAPGRAFLRESPPVQNPADVVGVATPTSRGIPQIDVPYQALVARPDGLYLQAGSLSAARLSSMEL